MALIDSYNNFNPDGLGPNNFNNFYINADAGRGDNPLGDIKLRLLNNKKGSGQYLFTGYRGCGKTTELYKLQKQIENEFIVCKFSIKAELDPINVNYVELFMLTMEKLFEAIQQSNLANSIDEDFLESINTYTDVINKEIVNEGSIGVDGSVGQKVPSLIEKLTGFFAELRLRSKISHSVKTTVNKVVEQRLSYLITHCNDLIGEVKRVSAGKGLVIFIEDLDKILLSKAEDLFLNYGNVITLLKTNVIFSFPIALRYNAKAINIIGNFDEIYELPMIKTQAKDGNNYDIGRNAIYDIIAKRLAANYFENDDLIYKFIDKSGGCLRDVFRMIKTAIDTALNDNRETIIESDFTRGYLKLKKDYNGSIAEKKNDDGSIVSLDAYYNLLKEVATNPQKREINNEASMDLRQSLCILSYNGEGWVDVHPIVRDILKDRGDI